MTQEEKALKIVCRQCRAGVSRPCIRVTKTGRPAGVFAVISRTPVKHPHRIRIDDAKALGI